MFFGEAFNPWKLVVEVVLLGFIYLFLHQAEGTKITGKWIVYVGLAFLFCGLIGVLQKMHQSSPHKDEIGDFLFLLVNGSAIVLTSVLSVVLFKEQLTKRQTVGLACGIGVLIALRLIS